VRMGPGVLKELRNPRTRPAPRALGILVLDSYVGQQKTWFWVMATKEELVDCWFLGASKLERNAIQSLTNELCSGEARGDHAAREISVV